MGCGTGDLAVAAHQKGAFQVVGIDPASAMLAQARLKDASIQWIEGSAENLPFSNGVFTVVMSAFVLRNLRGILDASLREFHRVLRPGGRFLALDLTRPKNPLIGAIHRFYLRWGVQWMGRLICGSRWPENYLKDTIQTFMSPAEIVGKLSQAGFQNTKATPLFFGVVHLIEGSKPW